MADIYAKIKCDGCGKEWEEGLPLELSQQRSCSNCGGVGLEVTSFRDDW